MTRGPGGANEAARRAGEVSLAEAGSCFGRSSEYARLLFRDGLLPGREIKLGPAKSRIWLDESAVLAHALVIGTRVQTEDEPTTAELTASDVEIGFLTGELREERAARAEAEHRARVAPLQARIDHLEQENQRLKGVIALLTGIVQDVPS